MASLPGGQMCGLWSDDKETEEEKERGNENERKERGIGRGCFPIFSPYSPHILPISYPYSTHILPIFYPYSTHILPISYPCPTHILPISYPCPTRFSTVRLVSLSLMASRASANGPVLGLRLPAIQRIDSAWFMAASRNSFVEPLGGCLIRGYRKKMWIKKVQPVVQIDLYPMSLIQIHPLWGSTHVP